MNNKTKFLTLTLVFLAMAFVLPQFVLAASEATVCCEETNSGLFCQDVPQTECSPSSRQAPTACDSTSFCRAGTCFDSSEGTCADNTPQLVCNDNDGIWSEESPPQCELGCCILGDQAAFVTQTRCKKLSADLGLETHYRTDIASEAQCVFEVQKQEKGACVFELEFERTCKFTTRLDCESTNSGTDQATVAGDFFEGKLCSAEELGSNCGPSEKTSCIPGKDGVYFLDTCGNPANIYDSSKLTDKAYWTNVIDKSEACNPNSPNANSAACGNCNYLAGSYCREERGATYGDSICSDLSCVDDKGNQRKHGESWCVYDDQGEVGENKNSVGSRFFKHICVNGEEVLEQCADFRQEECIEDSIPTSVGDFSQAACRVNRWQDCTAQNNKVDCENTDRRDCNWLDKIKFQNQQSADLNEELALLFAENGACVPQNSPGLKFWEGEEASAVCAQANAQCIVTFEKDLFGKESCIKNCHCLEQGWEDQRADLCTALGDCGPNVNWEGADGYKLGYLKKIGKLETPDN